MGVKLAKSVNSSGKDDKVDKEQRNLYCIRYLMRIGVLIPANKTDMINDFYRPHLRNIDESEQRKYKSIRVMRGFILKDCEDYTQDFVRLVNIIGMGLNINWYHVALRYCDNDFNIDNTYNVCRRLRYELSDAKSYPFIGQSETNLWYYMNQELDKYEPRPIPQFKVAS